MMKYKEKIENHLDSVERCQARVERMISEYITTGNKRSIQEALRQNKGAIRFTEHLRNMVELER